MYANNAITMETKVSLIFFFLQIHVLLLTKTVDGYISFLPFIKTKVTNSLVIPQHDNDCFDTTTSTTRIKTSCPLLKKRRHLSATSRSAYFDGGRTKNLSLRVRRLSLLSARNNNHAEENQNFKIRSKEYNTVRWMYLLLSMLHGSIVSFILTMPNQILHHRNVQPFRYNASYVGGIFGYVIASVVSLLLSLFPPPPPFYHHSTTPLTKRQIEQEAQPSPTEEDAKGKDLRQQEQIINSASERRSTSSNYLVLSLGLLVFSLIGLFAIPAEAAFHSHFKGAFMLYVYMSFVKAMGLLVVLQSIIIMRRSDNEGQKRPNLIAQSVDAVRVLFDELVQLIKKRNETQKRDGKIYQVLFQIIFYLSLGNSVLSFLQPRQNYLHKVNLLSTKLEFFLINVFSFKQYYY